MGMGLQKISSSAIELLHRFILKLMIWHSIARSTEYKPNTAKIPIHLCSKSVKKIIAH